MNATGQPWVEKYRPRTVKDVAHQEEVVNTLTKALETANLPHLLFYGPPGTGKTTTALAIARQLYGPEMMKVRVLELNASDERGISVVRDKIKAFAATAVGAPAPGYPSPPYKLLILDEADSMTQDAQNALRRTMEQFSRVTRFCIICNYVSRIIEPLASRCAKFRFKSLHEGIMYDRINYIAGKEGVSFKDPLALKTLSAVSAGDLRKAITTLQSSVRLAGPVVERSTLLDVSGQVPPEHIASLHSTAKVPPEHVVSLHSTAKVLGFSHVQACVTNLIASGYAAQQVLLQLQGVVLADGSLPDLRRAQVLELLASAEHSLVVGADEFLQLMHVASQMQKIYTC
ncbi:MAG: hypothetical protein WDW38_006041 [Sanguina aurantia]